MLGTRFPKAIAGFHHPLNALLFVSMSRLSIGLCEKMKKFGLSPKACKVLTTFFDGYGSELHPVNVNNGEMPAVIYEVEKNISRRIITMVDSAFMHSCCERGKGDKNVCAISNSGITKFIETT